MKLVSALTLALLSPLSIPAGDKAVPASGFVAEGTLPEGELKVAVQVDPKTKIDLPAKLYELKFEAGKSYSITMDAKENKGFDSFLVLQDKTGKQLAFDDDGGQGGEGLNSRLQFSPPTTDTYKVFAAMLNGQGKYVLKIGTAEIKKLELAAGGARVEAELTNDIKSLTYTVTLSAGKTYVIDMMAPAGCGLDSYLRLLDSSGKELDKNDDGGENQNARLTFSPPVTASFQIVATSFLGAGTGRFTLMVKEK